MLTASQKDLIIDRQLHAVRARVAEIHADGVASVPLDDRHQTALDLREGLVPGRRLEAAVALAREGIEADVLDLMCLRPLDRDAVAASIARTGRLATVEDGWGEFGVGAELLASAVATCFADLKGPPVRITGAHVPMPYASELQALALPSVDDVVRAVSQMVRHA